MSHIDKDNPEGPPSPNDWEGVTPAQLSDLAESVVSLPTERRTSLSESTISLPADRRASLAESTTSSTAATRSSWPALLRAFTRNRVQAEPEAISEDERTQWTAGTAYAAGDVVWVGDQPFRCEEDHTSQTKPSGSDPAWTRLEYKTYVQKHYRFSDHGRQDSVTGAPAAVASNTGAAVLLAVTEAEAPNDSIREPLQINEDDAVPEDTEIDASVTESQGETVTAHTKDVTFHASEAAAALLLGGTADGAVTTWQSARASSVNLTLGGEIGGATTVVATQAAIEVATEVSAATTATATVAGHEAKADSSISHTEAFNSQTVGAATSSTAAFVIVGAPNTSTETHVVATAEVTAEHLVSVPTFPAATEEDVHGGETNQRQIVSGVTITHEGERATSSYATTAEVTEVVARGSGTAVANVCGTMGGFIGAAATETLETFETSKAIDTTEATEVTQAIEAINARAVKVINASEATETKRATEAIKVTEDIEAPRAIEIMEVTETTRTTEAVETATEVTEIPEPIEATKTVEAIAATQAIEAIDTTELVEAIEATGDIAATEVIEAAKNIEATEVTKSTQANQVTEVTDATVIQDATTEAAVDVVALAESHSTASGSLDDHVIVEDESDTSGEIVTEIVAAVPVTTNSAISQGAVSDDGPEGDWQVYRRRRSSWRKSKELSDAPIPASSSSEIPVKLVVPAIVVDTDDDADNESDDDADTGPEDSGSITSISPIELWAMGTAYTIGTVVSYKEKIYRALTDTGDAPDSGAWVEVESHQRWGRPRRPGHHGSGHGRQHGQGHKRSVSRSRRRHRREARKKAFGSVGSLSSGEDESDDESDLGEGPSTAHARGEDTPHALEGAIMRAEVTKTSAEEAEATSTQRGTEAAKDFAEWSVTHKVETTSIAAQGTSLEEAQVADATETLARTVATATQWEINTTYAASAITTFAGASWLCLKEHVSLEPPTAGEYWYMLNVDSLLHIDLSALSLHWWSHPERFAAGTLVVYAGLVFRCLKENVGELPLPGVYWTVYEETSSTSGHSKPAGADDVSAIGVEAIHSAEALSAVVSDTALHTAEGTTSPSHNVTDSPQEHSPLTILTPSPTSTRSISTVSWSAETTYNVDQVIFYDHEWWRCIKTHEAVDAPAQGEFWIQDVSASSSSTTLQGSVDRLGTIVETGESEDAQDVTTANTSATVAESVDTDDEIIRNEFLGQSLAGGFTPAELSRAIIGQADYVEAFRRNGDRVSLTNSSEPAFGDILVFQDRSLVEAHSRIVSALAARNSIATTVESREVDQASPSVVTATLDSVLDTSEASINHGVENTTTLPTIWGELSIRDSHISAKESVSVAVANTSAATTVSPPALETAVQAISVASETIPSAALEIAGQAPAQDHGTQFSATSSIETRQSTTDVVKSNQSLPAAITMDRSTGSSGGKATITASRSLSPVSEVDESFLAAALGPNLIPDVPVSPVASGSVNEWYASAFYAAGVIVTFNGHKWQCSKDSINVAPSDGEFWVRVETSVEEDSSPEIIHELNSATTGTGDMDLGKLTDALKDWGHDRPELIDQSRGVVGTLDQIAAAASASIADVVEWSSFATYDANTVVSFEGSYWRSLERSVAGMTPAEGSLWAKVDLKVHPVTTLEQHTEWESNVQYLVGTVVWHNGQALMALQTHISSMEFLSDDWMWEDAVEVVVATRSVRTMSRRTSLCGASPVRPDFAWSTTPSVGFSPPPNNRRFVPGGYPSPPRPLSAIDPRSPSRDEHSTRRGVNVDPPDSPVLSPTRGSVSPPLLERLGSHSPDLPGHFPLSTRPKQVYPSPDSSWLHASTSAQVSGGSDRAPLYQPPPMDVSRGSQGLAAPFELLGGNEGLAEHREALESARGPEQTIRHYGWEDSFEDDSGKEDHPRPTTLYLPGHFAPGLNQPSITATSDAPDIMKSTSAALVFTDDREDSVGEAVTAKEISQSGVTSVIRSITQTATVSTSSEVTASPNTTVASVSTATEEVARVTRLEDKVAWAIGTLYGLNTIVWHGGAAWKCIAAHKAVDAPSSGLHWTKVNVGYFKPPPCPPNCKVDHTHRVPSPTVSVKLFTETSAKGALETTRSMAVANQTATTESLSQITALTRTSSQVTDTTVADESLALRYEPVTTVDDYVLWVYGRSYRENTVVWYDGKAWKAAITHLSFAPPSDLNTSWALDTSTPVVLRNPHAEAMYDNDAATAVAAIRASVTGRVESNADVYPELNDANALVSPYVGSKPSSALESMVKKLEATYTSKYGGAALSRTRSLEDSGATKRNYAARSVSESVRQVEAPQSVYGRILAFPSLDTIVDPAFTSATRPPSLDLSASHSSTHYAVHAAHERVATIEENIPWIANVEYASETVVWHNGVAWSCIKAHTSVDPPSEGEFWSVYREYIGAAEEAELGRRDRTGVAAGSGRAVVKESELSTGREVHHETKTSNITATMDRSVDMATETSFGIPTELDTTAAHPQDSAFDAGLWTPSTVSDDFKQNKVTPRRPSTVNSTDSRFRHRWLSEQRSPDSPFFSPPPHGRDLYPSGSRSSVAGVDDSYGQKYLDEAPNDFNGAHSTPLPAYPENVDYAALTTIDEHAPFTNMTGYLHNTVVWQGGIAWKCLESHIARQEPREGRFWTRVGPGHTHEPSPHLPSLYGLTLPGFHGHQDGRDVHVIHVYHHFIPAPTPGFGLTDSHTSSSVISWEAITTVESETQWNVNASYQVGSVLWYLGEAWKCVAAHTSTAPPYTGAYWVKVDLKGKGKAEGCGCGLHHGERGE